MAGKRVVVLVVALMAAVAVSACGPGGDDSGSTGSLAEQAWVKVEAGALLLDVRTPNEYNSGHIEGAKNISHDQIGARIGELGPDKERPIVLYCQSGRRTGIVAGVLRDAGFTNVFDAKRYDQLKAEWARRNS